MLQQALAYDAQLRDIKSQNKNYNPDGDAEYLSKVKKTEVMRKFVSD